MSRSKSGLFETPPPNPKALQKGEVAAGHRPAVRLGAVCTAMLSLFGGARLGEPQHVARQSPRRLKHTNSRALRVADPRSGARLCEPQQVRIFTTLPLNPEPLQRARLLRVTDPRSTSHSFAVGGSIKMRPGIHAPAKSP